MYKIVQSENRRFKLLFLANWKLVYIPWLNLLKGPPPSHTHTSDVSMFWERRGWFSQCNTAEIFSFGPNPTRPKKAWSSYTCLLYAPPPLQFYSFFPDSDIALCAEAKFIVADRRKRVSFLFRVVVPARQATYSERPVRQPYTGDDYIPYSGTMILGTVHYLAQSSSAVVLCFLCWHYTLAL